MVKSASKVVLIGLDAPIPKRVWHYAQQGLLPVIKGLIDRGVWAENCLAPYPTITPPNWTTLATGAWPGTHGITCFHTHIPGDPLDKIHQAFDSRECRAEYIWNAAAREGKKSIVLNYPSTWPSPLKDGIQIAGAALSLNEWRNHPDWGITMTLCHDQLFSTEDLPGATRVQLSNASGWKNAPAEALEATLEVGQPKAQFPFEAPTWHALVVKDKQGFGRVLVCESRDSSSAIADLRPGSWSEHITRTFSTENGPIPAVFALKLIELSPDASKLRIYLTPICALKGWSHPESVAEEIKSEKGLPLPYCPFPAFSLGWIDDATFSELVDSQHIWLADAAEYLLKNKPWEIFYMHAHCPDHVYHIFGNKWDPATNPDAEQVKRHQGLEADFYQSLDRMIGRIVEAAGPDALVVVTSDHGAKATTAQVRPAQILEEAGLTVFTGEGRDRRIDWTRTRAVTQRASYVYVNLKGRDPDGIVDPKDYDKVRQEVLDALTDYRDPATGLKPIALALKREDARILGLYGDLVGDVVYAVSPQFGGQHGVHLPMAEHGLGSLKALLIMAGPGVRKGHIMQRTAWLVDIVPTICHLADLPMPADAEGAVLYQALDDPDAPRKERQRVSEDYERLKQTFEADRQLTHRYGEPGSGR
jgi:predicted AlkP superfamily phosphohydrolase/phosphomutase